MSNNLIINKKGVTVLKSYEEFDNANFIDFTTNSHDSNNIDVVFDSFIKDNLIEKTFTNIFIPLNSGLSNLDFLGINLALHIRFTSGKNQLSNIFIYGISNFEFISKYNLLAGALLTKGIKLIDYSLEEIEKHLDTSQKLNDISEFKDELKKINIVNHIKQNEIYNSNNTDSHAVANIWGALRFADLTGLNETIKDNEQLQELNNDLYYKYISTISSETEKEYIKRNKITISKTNKQILYIDDNATQGWGDLLRGFFEDSIQVIGKNKEEKQKQFENNIIKVLEETDENGLTKWDLILLDLRLDPEKDKNKGIKELSGTKVLERIKKINKGIQVIMFTASNKAWNMRQLNKIGADGYYTKEHPHSFSKNIISNQQISLLRKDINKSLNNAEHLKMISHQINHFINENKTSKKTEFQNRSISALNLFFDIFKMGLERPKYINHSFLILYQILEDYSKQEDIFYQDLNEYYVLDNKNKPILIIKPKTEFLGEKQKKYMLEFVKKSKNHPSYYKKGESYSDLYKPTSLSILSFILHYRFNFNDQELKEFGLLNDERNTKAAHGGKSEDIKIKSVLKLFEIVYKVLFDKLPKSKKKNNINRLKKNTKKESKNLKSTLSDNQALLELKKKMNS